MYAVAHTERFVHFNLSLCMNFSIKEIKQRQGQR